MNVTTRLVISMITGEVLEHEFYEYNGPIALACGATEGMQDAATEMSSFFKTAAGQAQQVFGASSQVFKNLMSTFAPIVAAGPSQRGFALPESQALKSSAITNTGIAARNAKQATNEELAAVGGGNMPALPSGLAAGVNADINTKFAAKTADQLNNIEQADFATGRENWVNAVKGELGAPDVFNPATSAEGEAGRAGASMVGAQDNLAQAENSPLNAAIGAAGSVAGVGASALLKRG